MNNETRIKELEAMTSNQVIIDLAQAKSPHPVFDQLFEYSYKVPWKIYSSNINQIIPILECGTVLIGLREDGKYVEFSLEDPDDIWLECNEDKLILFLIVKSTIERCEMGGNLNKIKLDLLDAQRKYCPNEDVEYINKIKSLTNMDEFPELIFNLSENFYN